MPLRRVGIVGLGLIGASVGLALRRGTTPPEVVGFDIDRENLHRAARGGSVDHTCGTLAEVCAGSDLVVLAAPVRAILALLPEIAPHVSANTLVTDTGGTKAEIVRVGDSVIPRPAAFVGGHPLAGRLTAGVGDANAALFQGAVYCLTPSPITPDWAVDLATHFVESLGAQPFFLTADEHDALLAGASHLPYFASAAVVRALMTQPSWPEMEQMAAGGFRAITSLVDADPTMWADVGATNRENIIRQLDTLIERLRTIRGMVEAGDDALLGELQQARDAHRTWLSQRGVAPPQQPGSGAQTPRRRLRWPWRG
ncbi:MAG TPA: prephenate dehydrogenase [Chloroflexota bacterium]|nr:prephenate dehydrogenase [Chloroflexota bacterium]